MADSISFGLHSLVFGVITARNYGAAVGVITNCLNVTTLNG